MSGVQSENPARRPVDEPTLAQRLGYSARASLLIVNADDFGMSRAGNRATMDGLLAGAYSSTTVMVPCPWFPQAASFLRDHPAVDAGVHLTHTSEWEGCRWRPIAPGDRGGLCDGSGFFHRTVAEVYTAADIGEVEREARAQIAAALAAGIDVSHLDTHMGVMQLCRDWHLSYLRLAREWDVPVRTAGRRRLLAAGWNEVVGEMDRLGVLSPDHFHTGMPRDPALRADHWREVVANLPPGVTELYVHPALDEPELRDLTPDWALRVADHEFFRGPQFQELLQAHEVRTIGYREIREAQRAQRG